MPCPVTTPSISTEDVPTMPTNTQRNNRRAQHTTVALPKPAQNASQKTCASLSAVLALAALASGSGFGSETAACSPFFRTLFSSAVVARPTVCKRRRPSAVPTHARRPCVRARPFPFEWDRSSFRSLPDCLTRAGKRIALIRAETLYRGPPGVNKITGPHRKARRDTSGTRAAGP